jgi:hypothetical protein
MGVGNVPGSAARALTIALNPFMSLAELPLNRSPAARPSARAAALLLLVASLACTAGCTGAWEEVTPELRALEIVVAGPRR